MSMYAHLYDDQDTVDIPIVGKTWLSRYFSACSIRIVDVVNYSKQCATYITFQYNENNMQTSMEYTEFIKNFRPNGKDGYTRLHKPEDDV